MTSFDTDVLVVGGGPVGVAVGLFGVAHGLRVEVYETSVDPYPLPRAVVMDDEIQRLLASIGLGEELAAITTPLKGAEFVDAARQRIIGIDLPEGVDWPLGFFPVVAYHQPELEAMLRAAAIRSGVTLNLATEVVDVTEVTGDVDPFVRVTLRSSDGSETQRTARWLVGADGASSSTRKRAGISLTDLGFDQEWVVVDARLTSEANLPPITQQVCDPTRVITFVPGHAHWRRWELQVQPGETGAELSEPANIRRVLSSWIDEDSMVIERRAVYRFHATVAERLRSGQVFLAGDSAHQMPPFLGQGLCSGIRDAVNLTWKMGRVLRHESTAALLDSYDEERRPHATATVHHAMETGRLIDQLAAVGNGDTSGAYGGNRPAPVVKHGLVLPGHPLVGRPVPNPVLADGDRLDHHLGPRFTVLTNESTREQARAAFNVGALATLDATVLPVEAERFPSLVGNAVVTVIRPDRLIAAVLDLSLESTITAFAAIVDRWT
jgi:3-(3-hydroxy-phenyl)propionate hydroxylase